MILAVRWRRAEFLAQYARAREEQADYYADQIIEIADAAAADNTAVQRARLRGGRAEVDGIETEAQALRRIGAVWRRSRQPGGDGNQADHRGFDVILLACR